MCIHACQLSCSYAVPHMFFEVVPFPPLFLIAQQVHTHPMITAASTMIDKPVSDPRAIVGLGGACCACDRF